MYRRWSFLIGIFIFLVSLWGCASSPSSSELKTAEIRAKVLEDAGKASNMAREHQQRFLNCMDEYARKKKPSSPTITEFAEAAVSQCEFFLMGYINERRFYYDSMDKLNAESIDELPRIWDKAGEKARIDGQQLMESGKRLFMNISIEMMR